MRIILLFSLIIWYFGAFAQIANDDFKDATEISFGNDGFAFETIKAKAVVLGKAGIEMDEFIDSMPRVSKLNKSVWYWFEIPTARSIRIDLFSKSNNINPFYGGITVYEATNNIPKRKNLTGVFPSIGRFGASINSCTKPGKYYIQILGHSKNLDSSWIEVTSAPSPQATFDNPTEAYDLGLVTKRAKVEFEVGCLSIDSIDFSCSADSLYTQSNWFTFSTGSFPNYLKADLIDAVTKNKENRVLMSLYEGDCTKDLRKLTPIIQCKDSLNLECGLKGNTTYTVYMKWKKSFNARLKFKLFKRGFGNTKGADPNNMHDSLLLGTIKNNRTIDYQEHLTCASRMDNYVCEPTISANSFYPLHTMVTFTIEDSMILKIRNNVYLDTPKDESLDNFSWFARLHKGEINKNCPLDFDRNLGLNNCLAAGTYTLQIVFPESHQGKVILGAIVDISLRFRKIVKQKKGRHYTLDIAETLDTIHGIKDTILGLNKRIVSEPDYFASPDTFYTIDSNTYSGRFSFRTFYVANPIMVKMKSTGSWRQSNYVFYGRAQDRNLRKLDTIYGNPNPFSSDEDFESQCQELDTGWHTIMTIMKFECGIKDRLHENTVIIRVLNAPKGNFNYAQKAHLVNNLSPIGPSKNNLGTSENPDYRVRIPLPTGYFGCSQDIPRHIPKNCRHSTFHQAYYVFKLDATSFIKVFNSEENASYYLFPHDIRTDSSKFQNAANAIDPCGTDPSQRFYCKVPAGVYTLAFTGYRRDSVQPSLDIVPYLATENDFASSANNIKSISAGVNTSETSVIGCGTGYALTDYPIDMRSSIGFETLEYPIKNNQIIESSTKGNAWFTFTIDGPGEVEITGNVLNTPKYDFKDLMPMVIYEAPDGQEIDFSKLVASGKLDSTEEQGLHVMASNFEKEKDNLKFNKANCGNKRYYVLATFVVPREYYYARYPMFPNVNFQLSVDYKPVKHRGDEADYCSNALEVKLLDNDTASVKVNVTCHTLEESYGEDGSNMGCLGDVEEMKTSWIKVNFLGKKLNDVTLTLTENTTSVPQDIKYRVLSGSCNSMNPGPCVSEVVGGYKLDCVEKQVYYIQISTPKDALGTIRVHLESEESNNQFCDPVFAGPVMANFQSQQSCSGLDSISFNNLSTQGDSVAYKWYFDGNDKSTSKSPKYFFDNAGTGKDSFLVKLVVINTDKEIADSISKYVYKVRSFEFDAGPDLLNNCADSFSTKASSSMPPSAIIWSPSSLVSETNKFNTQVNVAEIESAYIMAKAYFEDCVIEDSFKVENNKPLSENFKLEMCAGQDLIISEKKNTPYFKWEDGSSNTKRTITQAGTYTLAYGASESCAATNTYIITEIPSPNYTVSDDINCIGDEILIEGIGSDFIKVVWSDNDTSFTKTILEAGTYTAEIENLQGCKTTYTKTVDELDLLKPSMQDVFVCEAEYELDANIADATYKWSTGETTQTIKITENGIYEVEIKKGTCSFRDDAKITFSSLNKFSISDTTACDWTEMTISLDTNYQYNWVQLGLEGHTVTITQPGDQIIEVSKNGCSKTENPSFVLYKTPEINLGLDTNLCPPFEHQLIAPTADEVLWFNGSTSDSFVTITDTGAYFVSAKNWECESFDTINVTLEDCFTDLFVPSAFTPGNNDAINPEFVAYGMNIDEFKMRVFNRWGELIFVSEDITQGWDGTFKGKDCPSDQFVYVIYYRAFKHLPKTKSGGVLLMR